MSSKKTKYTVFQNRKSGNIIKAWIDGVPLESQAKDQLLNMAEMPFIHRHIAVMPDVHLGRGATIGSVIPTKGAVIPASAGVDLGCFTGETEIPLSDGCNHKLKDLVAKDEFVVWSYDVETKKVVGALATAKLTRQDTSLVAVVLDNGETIRCTPDHQFMLRDGSYQEAKDLEIGASLMPFSTKRDKDNYTLIYQPKTTSYQRAHRIIARSGLMGDIPSFEEQRTVIHHKNFCEWDNTLPNLQFMGNKDHSRYHRSLVDRNTHWQSPEFETKRKAALAAKAATPEGHAYYAERGTKNILKYMEDRPEHYKESVVDNGQRGKKYLVSYNKSEKGRAKSKEHANTVYECEVCGDEIKSPIGYFASHLPACKRKHGTPGNHKVVDIIFIDEKEDVYCLNVPKYHNFALTSGVFVHNCGMVACKTNINANDLPDSLKLMRENIERAVPHGRTDRGGRNDRGSWHDVPDYVADAWAIMEDPYKLIGEKHPKIMGRGGKGKTAEQLATMGSGNHFCEVCLDQNNDVWLMLHSGSRGVGNRIGQYFINLAKKDMEKWFINLPDKDLSYFPEGTDHFDDYIEAVSWAQNFARVNRDLMMEAAIKAVRNTAGIPDNFAADLRVVNCHHNYISRENHFGENVIVTRKGAVSAKKDEWGIIPGSMGAKSFIVIGKGNKESFHSCSHGAGRVMSRTEAKRRFTLDQHIKATEGVECRKDAGVIDETPAAYKDIDAVMRAQSDLVTIAYTLKQVLCVKG